MRTVPKIVDPIDGSTLWKDRWVLADVYLNGLSVMALRPIEVFMRRDGWGYVCTQVQLATGVSKKQIDGQQRNYTAWGWVSVAEMYPEPSLVFGDADNSGWMATL